MLMNSNPYSVFDNSKPHHYILAEHRIPGYTSVKPKRFLRNYLLYMPHILGVARAKPGSLCEFRSLGQKYVAQGRQPCLVRRPDLPRTSTPPPKKPLPSHLDKQRRAILPILNKQPLDPIGPVVLGSPRRALTLGLEHSANPNPLPITRKTQDHHIWNPDFSVRESCHQYGSW